MVRRTEIILMNKILTSASIICSFNTLSTWNWLTIQWMERVFRSWKVVEKIRHLSTSTFNYISIPDDCSILWV